MNVSTGSDMVNFIVDLRFAITFPLGAILILTLLIHLVYHFCTRQLYAASHHHQTRSWPQNADHGHDHQQNFVAIDVGALDEAILHTFPKLLYSQYKLQNSSSSAYCCCCSICLNDYKESDLLQLLPDCGHLFHPNCIHPWLRMHPNCPICRKTLLPIPNTTHSHWVEDRPHHMIMSTTTWAPTAAR